MTINVNSTQISALLQLYPMAIPGAEENLLPPGTYHLGISESIHSPSTKLFIVIDPVTLFSMLFAAGDSVRLWVNGQATSVIKPIKPGEENDRIFMELPWGVLKDGLNTLYYEVTRVSGNKDQSTPILKVLFNNPISSITVSHPASIGPGQSAAVTLTRSDPRQFDDVELTIGSWRKTIPYVHPANPINYTLTALDLPQIGDGTRSVSATIKDQLSNLRVSPTTSITITANQKVLNPPIIVEAEANNRVLDIPALAGKDATIHALIWTGILVGQQIWLKLTGKKPDGSTVTFQRWNGGSSKVNATWNSQRFWPAPLPASFLSQLVDGSRLLMEFWVSEDKSNNFAAATKFPDQVYTVKTMPAVVLSFINAPYTVTAGGQVVGIELLVTQAGQPTAGKAATVTLPQGTTFADGTNVGNFVTGSDGKVRLVGVTASSAAGTSSITAVSGGGTANAVLTINAQAPLGPIALSPSILGVAYSSDGNSVYVTGLNFIQVIDANRSTVINRIPSSSLDVSWDIVPNQDGSRLFACNGNNALSVLDTNTNSWIAHIYAAGHPIRIVLNEDGSQAFFSTWNTGKVVVINTNDLSVAKVISAGSYPRGIDRSQDGQNIYVGNFGNGGPFTISVIDTKTLTVVNTVPMPVAVNSVAASRDNSSIYVSGINNNGQGFVMQYDVASWMQIRSIPVVGYPRGLRLNHAGNRAYYCDAQANTFSTIDTLQGKVIATKTVGKGPVEIAIRPDDSSAVVACTYDSTVWVESLLPSASPQGASSIGMPNVTNTSPQPRPPIPGDLY